MDILYFVLRNLLLFHTGITLFGRLKSLTKIAALFSFPAWLGAKITDWSVTNQDYIAGVLACIAIDHFVGTIYHAFKLRDFTFRKNAAGLLSKLALCIGAAILFEVIYIAVKDVSLIYEYLKVTTRLIIILYPAGSAFMNMSLLTNGMFPPVGWIKKIAAFNEKLDLKKLHNDGPDNAT